MTYSVLIRTLNLNLIDHSPQNQAIGPLIFVKLNILLTVHCDHVTMGVITSL